jgi:hypothetical protein
MESITPIDLVLSAIASEFTASCGSILRQRYFHGIIFIYNPKRFGG